MTALGVNVSDRDPAYTWADLHPAGRGRPEYLIAARDAVDAALGELDELIATHLTERLADPAEVAAAAERVRAAEAAYGMAWIRWQTEQARRLAESENLANSTHDSSLPRGE